MVRPNEASPIRSRPQFHWHAAMTCTFRSSLLAAFAFLAPVVARAAVVDPELEALRARLYCPILAYLQAIHAHAPTPHERFLVVGWKGHDAYYVQCLFYDDDSRLLCEVASGFWETPRARLVPPERIPRLAALGFSTKGEKRNFQRRRRVTGPESLAETADTIVRAFREVYAVGANEAFTMVAPLVPKRPPYGTYVDGICETPSS